MPPETTTCQRPACSFKTLKGLRGLNVHLRRSPRCADWYKDLENNNDSTLDPSQNAQTVQNFEQHHTLLPESPVPWSSVPKPKNNTPNQYPGIRFAHAGDAEDTTMGNGDGGLGDVGNASTSLGDRINAQPNPAYRVEKHPTAGEVFGKARTILEEIDHNASEEWKKNMYHPFSSSEDFEVGAWLSQSGVPMTHIDKFLKLPYVSRLLSWPSL